VGVPDLPVSLVSVGEGGESTFTLAALVKDLCGMDAFAAITLSYCWVSIWIIRGRLNKLNFHIVVIVDVQIVLRYDFVEDALIMFFS
jgi:hypothetical protein